MKRDFFLISNSNETQIRTFNGTLQKKNLMPYAMKNHMLWMVYFLGKAGGLVFYIFKKIYLWKLKSDECYRAESVA